MIGFVVGMRAEARLLCRVRGQVAISGATRSGAERAVARLIGSGVDGLVSLGLAAGLDPAMRPGDLLVPSRIVIGGVEMLADPALCARLGGASARGLLHSDHPVVTAAEKAALAAASGCAALDMESGIVARAAASAGLRFAALRAICDPAERDLPHAACVALNPDGGFSAARLAASVLRHPAQLRPLFRLARDAAAARRALVGRIATFAG